MTDPGDAAGLRAALVAQLREAGHLQNPRVAEAFAVVAREHFVRGEPLTEVYRDRHFITHREDGVATSSSSQPAIMAIMLELLDVQPGDRVLEIGAGTGYNAALLAEIAGRTGHVTTIEIDPLTASEARAHLGEAGASAVEVITADGVGGHAPGAPYDRVIATASAWQIPGPWVTQLREGGRLVLPLRLNDFQIVLAFERRGDGLVSTGCQGGGFMHVRGDSGFEFSAELPGGIEVGADDTVEDRVLSALADHWEGAREASLAVPGDAPAQFLLYLALQGAPLVTAVRRGPGGEGGEWWVLLVTSAASALRWRRLPPVPGAATAPDVLGDDEALDFARAALARWQLERMPRVEDLHARVTPARGPRALGALPRPVAGRYRFARGAHAYELWFERGGGTAT